MLPKEPKTITVSIDDLLERNLSHILLKAKEDVLTTAILHLTRHLETEHDTKARNGLIQAICVINELIDITQRLKNSPV